MGKVLTYSMALQDGSGVVKPCMYRDQSLYNKLLQDATTSARTIVNQGSLSDVMNYLGSDFFKINFYVPEERRGTPQVNLFAQAFPNLYYKAHTQSLCTNGLFEVSGNASNPDVVDVTASGAVTYQTPLGTKYGITSSSYGNSSIYFSGIINEDNDFLNGYGFRVEIDVSESNKWNLIILKESNSSWYQYMVSHLGETVANTYRNFFYNTDPDGPYTGGGYSTTGGGDPQKQNWAEESDFVKEDAMPDETNYSAQSCGLITIFTPSKAQLQRLSDVIWGQGFFNWVQNMVQNISDFFISLGMVPFSITPGQSVEVTWLNYVVAGAVSFTDIYLYKCPNQFIEFDMGSISLTGSDNRIFANDSALDYSPYSKLGIYLPFIGYQELDIDECRNQTIHLKYRIDVLSGTTVALLSLRELADDPETSRTIYQFTGNCLTQLPITSADYQTMVTNAVNLGLSLASAGATGAIASAGDAVSAERISEGSLTAAEQGLQSTQRTAQVASAGGGALSATANAIMGMKPNFKKSGGIGASASLLSVKQPYLFLTTPRQSMPEGYNKVCGFPCNIYGNLGSFSGYTVVEDIRLNGLVATSPEVEEIYQLLKTGVII